MPKTLISTPLNITTSDTAVSTVDITSGIDDTYSVYEFHFYNIHASDDDAELQFQVNASDGADWNDSPLTTTFFSAYHNEDDSGTPALSYHTGHDIANAATFQNIHYNLWNNVNESGMSGSMTLYDPSSTTYVKHFMSRTQNAQGDDVSVDVHAAGYINTTSAIDEISFKFDSGNIDAGVIKMYGLAKS